MTTNEAAEVIGCTPGQVRVMVRNGKLRADKIQVSNKFYYWEIVDKDVKRVAKEDRSHVRGRKRGQKVNGVKR